MFLGLFNAIRTLTVDDKILVIQSPPWIGWACIVAGVVIMLGAFVRRLPRPVRLGALLGTLLLIYGGWHLLRNVRELADLGEHLGAGLYAREVDYLCQEEWATSAEDILWRRTKLGLFMSTAQQARLAQYLKHEHPRRPRADAA